MSNNPTGFVGNITQGVLGGPNANAAAPVIDQSQVNAQMNQGAADAAQEQAALNEQQQMAEGKGPSAATALLNQQTATTMNANNAAASSGSGGGGLAKRQAMEANSGALQTLGGQAATARAQEQIGAMANQGNLATGMRGQDIQGAGLEGQLATNQAQIGEQQNQANAQSATSNQKANAGMLSTLGALGQGAMSFLDADFKEPAPPGSKDEDGEPPAWFTIREERGSPEHEPFLALIDRTTGRAMKFATAPLTPSEHAQLYKPHAAGALDSPDRKHAEMHDLTMAPKMAAIGGGMGNGAGMMAGGANPGYGAMAGGGMDVGGNTKLVNAQQAAVGGSKGAGAATGQQYADADFGDDRFAELVRRAHPALYKAATPTYSDGEVGPIAVGPVADPAYRSTPEGDRALGNAISDAMAEDRQPVPGYVAPTEASAEASRPGAVGDLGYGEGPKSKEEQAAKDAADARKAEEEKAKAPAPAAVPAPAPEHGHGVVHDILTAIRGAFGGVANPTGAAGKPAEAETPERQREKQFADQLAASQKTNDPRSTFMASQGPEHFVPPVPESPKVVAPPNPEAYSDAEMRGPYATRGAPGDGDSAKGFDEQNDDEDARLASIRKAMAESDQSAEGTKTYSDAEMKGAYSTRGTVDDGDAASGLTEQRDDEDPRLSEIRKAMAGSDQSAKGTKTYGDGEVGALEGPAATSLSLSRPSNVGQPEVPEDEVEERTRAMRESVGQPEPADKDAEDKGFDRPDLVDPYAKLPQPSLAASKLIPGLRASGYKTFVNERGEREMDVPEETMRVAPPALSIIMSKGKPKPDHLVEQGNVARTSEGNRARRTAKRRAGTTYMDGDMDAGAPNPAEAEVKRAKGITDREVRKAQLRKQLKDVDAWEDAQRKTYPDADAREGPTKDADEPPEVDVEDLPSPKELASGKRLRGSPVDLDAAVPDVDDPLGWPAAKVTYAPGTVRARAGTGRRPPLEDPASIPANFPETLEEAAAHVAQVRDIERMNPYGAAPKKPVLAALFPAAERTSGAGPVDFMSALHLANKKYDREGGMRAAALGFEKADRASVARAKQLRAAGLDVVPGEFEELAEKASPGERAAVVSEELEKRSASRRAVRALVAKWEAERKGRRQYADGDLGTLPGKTKGSSLVVVMRPGSKPRVRVREAG